MRVYQNDLLNRSTVMDQRQFDSGLPRHFKKSMKPDHFQLYFNLNKAKSLSSVAESTFRNSQYHVNSDIVAARHKNWSDCVKMTFDLNSKWKKVRDKGVVEYSIKSISDYFNSALLKMDSYSGYSDRKIDWVFGEVSFNPSTAYTNTSKGAQYSSKCTYRKTDAVHVVKINAIDAISILENWNIALASQRDSVTLLSLIHFNKKEEKELKKAVNLAGNKIYKAAWLKGKKYLSTESGFVAVRGDESKSDLILFHSTKSPKHAIDGIKKKVLAKKAEERQRKMENSGRGAFFGQKNISLKEVRALTGWCGPGCKNWLDTYMPDGFKKVNYITAPYWVVAEAARNAAKFGDSYGKSLLNKMGLPEKQIQYSSPNLFTIWTL